MESKSYFLWCNTKKDFIGDFVGCVTQLKTKREVAKYRKQRKIKEEDWNDDDMIVMHLTIPEMAAYRLSHKEELKNG